MILDVVILLVLISLAIFLLILELFFLPGVSIAALFSLAFYGAAIFFAFAHIGSTVGFITLIVSLLLTIFIIWYFMRSRTLDKMSLHTNIDSTAPTRVSSNINIGDQGITISRLNPMGRVLIGNVTVEARSIDFIDEGTPVIIKHIEQTTIFVEPVEK